MFKFLSLFFIAFLSLGCSTLGYSSDTLPIEKLINYERIDRNLAPLTIDSKIKCASRTHALDIGKNKYCSHYGSDRSSFATRLRRCGFEISKAEEIVACNYFKPHEALTTWLGSTKQRNIILGKDFTKLGCGMFQNYWVCILSK